MKTIRLDGIVGLDITAQVAAKQITDKKAPLMLVVNTPGGNPLEAFSIYNMLKEHQAPVHIRADLAASAGSIIACAGHVSMAENSSLFMIHNVFTVAAGGKEDLRNEADVMEMIERQAVGIYAEKTGMLPAKLTEMMAKSTYMNATQAKEYGFCNEILRPSRSNLVNMAVQFCKLGADANESAAFSLALDNLSKSVNNLSEELQNAAGLKDVEAIFRDDLGLTRSEATAFTARIKAIIGCDNQQATDSVIQNRINNLLKRL